MKKLMMRLGRGSFQLQRVLENFGQLVFRVVKQVVLNMFFLETDFNWDCFNVLSFSGGVKSLSNMYASNLSSTSGKCDVQAEPET